MRYLVGGLKRYGKQTVSIAASSTKNTRHDGHWYLPAIITGQFSHIGSYYSTQSTPARTSSILTGNGNVHDIIMYDPVKRMFLESHEGKGEDARGRISSTNGTDFGESSVRAFIAIGSNLGRRLNWIERALRELKLRGIIIKRTSSLWETEPMYVKDQDRFLNGVIEVGRQTIMYMISC